MEEKVMSRLKQAVKMLRYNFSSIAFFEIVYRVLSLAILTPAMYGLLNVSMDTQRFVSVIRNDLPVYAVADYLCGIPADFDSDRIFPI